MLNNKIDDDSNIKVCVKIYWKKTTVTLIILRKQLHGPLVIIVHKVSRCHRAMRNEFCSFENSWRNVPKELLGLDSISIVDHTARR